MRPSKTKPETSEDQQLLDAQDASLEAPVGGSTFQSSKNTRITPLTNVQQTQSQGRNEKRGSRQKAQIVELPNIGLSNTISTPANHIMIDRDQIGISSDLNMTKSHKEARFDEGSQDVSLYNQTYGNHENSYMEGKQPFQPKYKMTDKEEIVEELNDLNNLASQKNGPILTHKDINKPMKTSIHNLDEVANLKYEYFDKFGKSFQMSSIYIHAAKIIPKQPQYLIHVSIYYIPEQQQSVISHIPGKELKTQVLPMNSNVQTVYLNLLKREEHHLSLHKQQQLTANSIKIEFSQDGNFLAILINQTQLSVYEVKDSPYTLMKQIKGNVKLFEQTFEEPHENIYFSPNSQYIGLWSIQVATLIEIRSQTLWKQFIIDHVQYSQVLDLHIDENQRFLVTLQQNNKQQVDLLEMGTNQYVLKNIQYKQNDIVNLKTVVTKDDSDNNCLVYCNTEENYYIQKQNGGSRNHFRQWLHQLKGYKVLKIYDNQVNRIILCTKEGNLYLKKMFDPDFSILLNSSQDAHFAALDHIRIDENNLTFIYLHNNDLCIDNVDLQLQQVYNNIRQNEYAAFCASWPYIAYQASNAKLTIICAQDTNLLHQIKVPHHQMRVQQIQINEDILYFIGKTTNGQDQDDNGYCHILYCVNLAPLQGFSDLDKDEDGQYDQTDRSLKVEELFKYYENDVECEPFVGFNICKQLQTINPVGIFQHGDRLYQHQMINCTGSDVPQNLQKMILVDFIHGSLIERYEEGQIYRQKEESKILVIKQLQNWVDHVESVTMFKKSFSFLNEYESISNWLWDEENDLIIVLIGTKYENSTYGTWKKSTLHFINQNSNEIIKTIQFFDQNIRQILEEHKIVSDGHIYFQNSVLKIRYDLFDKVDNEEYRLFNIYNGILDIEKKSNFKIFMQGFPITCKEQRRLFYLSSNHNIMKPKEAYFLPYLHTREMKLDDFRRGQDDEVFQTEYISSSPYLRFLSLNITQQTFSIVDQCGVTEKSFDISAEIEQYGHPVQVSTNGQLLVCEKNAPVEINNLYQGMKQEIFNNLAIFTIFRMTEKGLIKLKEIPLHERLDLYTTQIPKLQKMFEEENSIPKQINIDQIKEFHEYFNHSKEIHYNVSINDQMDICIHITNKTDELIRCQHKVFKESETQVLKSVQTRRLSHIQNRKLEDAINEVKGSMYYYERGRFGKEWAPGSKVQVGVQPSEQKMVVRHLVQQRVFLDIDTKLHGFVVSEEHLITWTNNLIQKLYLFSDEQSFETIMELPGENVANTIVENVKVTSGRADRCMIVCRKESNRVALLWDLEQNHEIEHFDLPSESEIIQDKIGNFYIIQDREVLKTNEMVKLHCFVQNCKCTHNKGLFQKRDYQAKTKVNMSLGYKFDAYNDEWILNNDCAKRSYSGMSFIMHQYYSDNIQSTMKDFDIEKYNFIFQSNHLFSLCCFKDFEGIIEVIDALKRDSISYIDFIHYKYKINPNINNSKHTTIIEYAQAQRQIKFVDMYLRYLQDCKYDTSYIFYHQMNSLLICPEFTNYLKSWEIQTQEMKDKQILQIRKDQYHEKCKSVAFYQGMTNKLMLDENFFENQLGDCPYGIDDKDFQTVTVHISALRVDWIIQTHKGLMFIESLFDQQNSKIYQNQQIQYVVRFIYNDLRNRVFKDEVPIYLVQLGLFFITSMIVDRLVLSAVDLKETPVVAIAFVITNLVLAMYAWYLGVQHGQNARENNRFNKSAVWTVIQVMNNTFNILYSILILVRSSKNSTDEAIRDIAAILSITYWIRLIKYLEMIETISPLINVIYKITREVRYLVMIFFILVFCFGTAFYYVGQNQLEFDGIQTYDEEPWYTVDVMFAFNHVFNNAVGEVNIDDYSAGKATQRVMLWILYHCNVFICFVLMLNMMIALMSAILQKSNEDQNQNTTKEKLRFIIDNWGKGSEQMSQTKFIVNATFSKQLD